MFLLLTRPMGYVKCGSTVYLSDKLKDRGVDCMILNESESSKKFIFQKSLSYQTKSVDGLNHVRIAGSTRENPRMMNVHFADVIPDWLDDIEEMKI